MGSVMTAGGPVDAAELGITLMHEHIFINMLIERRPTGLLNDYALMRQEIGQFVAAGGRTIVDLTVSEITSGAAPDPAGLFAGTPATGYAENGSRSVNNVLALQKLSEDAGLNIILGTGHYRDPYLDRLWIDRVGTDRLADLMVTELTDGIAGTNVRAGIIGEIGADKWYISAVEERCFRAAARAHRNTGVPITTHAAKWPVGTAQLDLLREEDVDPRRVIVGHCDTVNIPEYHDELARRGSFVQFDNIRCTTDYDLRLRVDLVMSLVRHGYLDSILLSQDVCNRAHLNISGGGGYTFVPVEFAAALNRAGLSKEELEHILVDNPRRALSGE